MAHTPPEVTIVIPAFNEATELARQLDDVSQVMGRSGWAFEIIVVDDGSTDETANIAEGCGVRVLRLKRNSGYGYALKAGISASSYEWILITDADGTYPPAAILKLLERSAEGRMVVGARLGANVHAPLARRPAKWLLRLYASAVVWRHIPDLNSGLRLIPRHAVKRFWDLLPPGFSFTTTITMSMLATSQDVSYIKIDYLRRVGESKIRPSDFFRFLRLITRLGLRFRPLRILAPAGLLIVLAAAGAGWPGAGLTCALLPWSTGLYLERAARRERALQ